MGRGRAVHDEGRVVLAWIAAAVIGLSPHPHHHRHSPWTEIWHRGAMCIHRHESIAWHHEWRIGISTYAGGFSMLLGTWERGGGRRSNWVSASPYTQTLVAYHIWRQDGGSWREWPTRRYCGLS